MAWVPLAAAGMGALGSIGGGYLASQGNQETKLQRQRRKLIDELLQSLKSGQGAFSDLFDVNDEAFQKSIVDPAMSRFQNQVAPGIQQEYIAAGMQRGTGLEDSLARAGVDLQNEINQLYGNWYQSAIGRKQELLKGILTGSEAGPQQTPGQAVGQAAAGYFASPGFGKLAEEAGKYFGGNSGNSMPSGRVGYEQMRNTYSGGY